MLTPAALAARLRPSRRLLNWSATVVAAYALFGFLAVPQLLRQQGEALAGAASGRTVELGSVQFNPFTLALTLDEVRVLEADGSAAALSVDRVHANFELQSVLRGGPVLHELRVVAPRLQVVRGEDGRYNWSDLFERLGNAPEGGGQARFSLGNIRLSGGEVVFDDRRAGVRHELSEIGLELPFLSNLPVKVDVFVEPALSARVNGRPFQLGGRTRPFAEQRETVLDIRLDKLELAPYLAYLPFEPAFVLRSGHLSSALELAFIQRADGQARIALNGELRLGEFKLDDAAATQVAAFEELAVELVDLQPLAGKWHFTRLRLQSPEIDLVRERDGSLNLARLVPGGPRDATASRGGTAGAFDFLLATARVRDGVLRFEDRSPGTPFRTRLQAINIDLRDLATAGDMLAEIRADFHSDAGERFEFQEQLRLAPFELDGIATVEALRPANLAPYYAAVLPAGELREGALDAVLHHRVRVREGEPRIELRVENLALRELVLGLKGRKRPLAELDGLSAAEILIMPAERRVTVGNAELSGLALAVERDRAGRLDALDLLGPPSPASAASTPPWHFVIERLAAGTSSFRLEDRSAGTPVLLVADQIDFSAEGLGNAPGARARVELRTRINQRGRIALDGTLALAPFKTDLKVDLRSVDLLPLQPYVLEQTKIAISRGNLTSGGRLALEQLADGTLKGRFRGDLGVANFASVDRLNATDFVRWRTLRLAGVDLALSPFALSVRELALTDFRTRLILDENGTLNLREIRPPAEPAEGEGDGAVPVALADAGAVPPISIGKVVIRQGNIAFSDRFIRPNYDANLTGMSGELLGLSSDPTTLATLELTGKVDNAAPVSIRGTLNPFRQDRHLDIAASVSDFELSSVSAYSGKYVGYGIEKGKLSAELQYRVEDRQLSATNRIFLDQLTFGPQVDSPDAIKAPVQLAVALLKNRRGEIDIHLPVRGTLDDPQFSVAGLVFRAIMNLIGKAITSPFALLGSMFGGGEELAELPFAAGATGLDATAMERVGKLAEALRDRPALRLEVTGIADPEADPDGLRRVKMLREVQALKLKDSIRRGEEAPPLDEVEVSAEEYPALLRQVYRAGDFKKERNIIGMVKDVPLEQMEEVILSNTAVSADELGALAQQRAQGTRAWLVEQGGVPAERVFVLAPRVEPPGAAGCTRCVRFSLR